MEIPLYEYIKEKEKIATLDTTKIYKITFKSGDYDLVHIWDCDLFVELYSFLSRDFYQISNPEFIELYKKGNIKEV